MKTPPEKANQMDHAYATDIRSTDGKKTENLKSAGKYEKLVEDKEDP